MQTTLILVFFFLRCIVFVCFLSSTNSTPIGLDQKIKTSTKLMNRENGSFIDNPSFLKAHNKKKSASIFYIAAKHCNLTEFEQWWITLVEDDENADLTDRNVLTICDRDVNVDDVSISNYI
ncbi:hypothetical protein CRE_27692 [Caenorhabditis remanei]|uniref:Uncharacterized protein n=1 Tax=Caenorhabditis remanei TaxID=31234 RepID=E3MKJ8_CAERE|nr:hypothetical protein CRE_27692 [Caenorhabditis remanei]